MPRKPKKETAFDLIKKEQLRAKELTLSEEYIKDITEYQKLEEELVRWRMEEKTFRNLFLTPHPVKDSPEVRAHIQKGRKLRNEIFSLYDNILKKYSISRPCSLDLLKQIANGLEQKGLRHRDEIPVKMLLPSGPIKIIEFDGYQVSLDSKECFSIEINPRGTKTHILHYVSKLLDACAGHDIKSDTRFRDERLRDFEVYRLKCLGKDYKNISNTKGIRVDTARKAFGRIYSLIHDMPYKAGTKMETPPIAYMERECNTCEDKPSCRKLCPEVEAYANQGSSEAPKFWGLISDHTPDPNGPAVPAKGKGNQIQGKRTFKDENDH